MGNMVIDDRSGSVQREMSLGEWCGRLPPGHRVNVGLLNLRKNANKAMVVMLAALFSGMAAGLLCGYIVWGGL